MAEDKKKKACKVWLDKLFYEYRTTCIVIIAIILFIFAALSSYFPQYGNSLVTQGFFTLAIALITAISAIHKYQGEQRTLRLQRLYFEDTLLGQARSMEEVFSQTNKNMLLVEGLFNLTFRMLENSLSELAVIKNNLINIFDATLIKINFADSVTEFKKETISKLLRDAEAGESAIPTWIRKFENDSYRFFTFLQNEVLLLKLHMGELEETNKESFLVF
jgi:hypothetical protein